VLAHRNVAVGFVRLVMEDERRVIRLVRGAFPRAGTLARLQTGDRQESDDEMDRRRTTSLQPRRHYWPRDWLAWVPPNFELPILRVLPRWLWSGNDAPAFGKALPDEGEDSPDITFGNALKLPVAQNHRPVGPQERNSSPEKFQLAPWCPGQHSSSYIAHAPRPQTASNPARCQKK